VFVTNGVFFPNAKKITQDIRKAFDQVKTVVQMIQNKQTPIALYGEEKVLFGPGYIEDGFDGLIFRLSAKSFYQINPEQMIKLYDKALDMANIKITDKVMDCYSGIGTISLLAAKKARDVVAIEINHNAVNDAKFNAKTNKIENISFHCDDVEKFMYGFNKDIDILILDPTRTGATEKFLSAVKKLKPRKIVYISCFPETQARDLKSLLSMYYIKEIQPVDMFSYTEHVENIVLLSLKS
jgi:23S rRNA (uracil1939-C5)-methyltransferase